MGASSCANMTSGVGDAGTGELPCCLYQPGWIYLPQVLPEHEALAPAPLPVFLAVLFPSTRISQLTAAVLSL